MRTEDLYYFITVAKTHSLNKASQKLGVSYQSINTGIKNLEAELGLTLFERNSQGTFLTKEGEIAEASARRILKEAKSLMEVQQKNRPILESPQECGQLTVGLYKAINNIFMPSFISQFHRAHPKIHLSIMEYESSEILDKFAENKFDLCLFSAPQRIPAFSQNSRGINHRFYMKTTLHAYMSNDHPLANRKSLSLNTITKYPLSIFSTDSSNRHSDLEDWLKDRSATITTSISTSNFQSYLQSVWDDNTIAFIPASSQNKYFFTALLPKETVLIPIHPKPLSYHFFVTRSDYTPKKQQLVNSFLNDLEGFLKN